MNDNQNFLLRDSQNSQNDARGAGIDRHRDRRSEVVGDAMEEQITETSSKFGSRTYVSSRGYFFQ